MTDIASTPLAQTIQSRRSIKKFTDQPVDKQTILELLEISKWAPDHGVREPWRFLLFLGSGMEKLAEALADYQEHEGSKKPEKIRAQISELPGALLVVNQAEQKVKKWEEDFGAASTLIQNFQLLSWEQNLGMIWKTGDYIYSNRFKQSLGIDPEETIVGMLQLGYFEKIPKAKPRTSIEEKINIFE
ncbi:Nitroreductase [Marinococcus luteus]|uniref:Putative NAD(P)H nitroreductase n=1 Tax=Marinococcus luteus TaxID=1122204 RepID=A0A1H2X3S4_9BACI|nr:nitroreductase [Marinococcus luteus]SDW87540.1 Nitroreductase [Marinococcus luteus]